MNQILSEDLKMKLKSFYKDYLWNYAPGTYELLERICVKEGGSSFIDLLFNDPGRLKNILSSHYSDEHSLKFFIQNIIIKPLLIKLERLEMLDALTSLFLKDSNKFKEEILSLIEYFKTSKF